MHSCPACSQVCFCDGEDLWYDWPFSLPCAHACEDDDVDLPGAGFPHRGGYAAEEQE